MWLKAHNRYYEDIIIDEEILQSLPENSSITDLLPQQTTDKIPTDEENGEDEIARSFVPLLTLTRREDTAINDTLNRMQTNNPTLPWPVIDRFPINKFQMPSYIAKAFLILYPHGDSDL